MRSRIGEPFQSAIFAGLPPIAVPITVKMPDPITAPMPSAVSETGPSVFFKACSGLSDSEISLSIDFVAKICLASALAPAYRRIGAGRFNCSCVSESERDCHHAVSGARNRILSAPESANYCPAECLPLALAAGGLPDLGLVFATSACARALRGRLLPCCALYFFALDFVGNALGICHVSCQSLF